MNEINASILKRQCPMPELLKRLGMAKYAKASCASPFRPDSKPSWGIFKRDGTWHYKDFSTGETGDEIRLLAQYLKLNERQDFKTILQRYQQLASQEPLPPLSPVAGEATPDNRRPDFSGLARGIPEQLHRLSASRGISMVGLEWAQERGVLVFGRWHGLEVYGVRDESSRVLELRRLDGEMFGAIKALPERKSHAVKGSQKKWPVGILEAKAGMIILAEGIPDFLAAHDVILSEGAQARVAPVGMLSAAVDILPEALEYFRGKHVRLFPHADKAGLSAARKWSAQLKLAGARRVDFYDFGRVPVEPNERLKDLCDLMGWQARHPEQERKLLNE